MGRIRAPQIQRALKRFTRKPSVTLSENPYARFDLIDGRHPWQEVVPDAALLYHTRKLSEGEVVYFNFQLAKEMGLIPRDHAHKITPSLRKKILDTFNLRIVNEYDQKNNVRYHPAVMKPNQYMATRYLQLQHPDKCGRTSGDGRSIWNGCIEFNGTLWDISSRGTGVTALAPGVVEAGKPLESGNTRFGYGCGMADLDELYAAAIMAEIFHRREINTERMLAIIDIDGTNGIGVRAGKNLIRPAHLFAPLKQGNWELLKKAADYLIQRQYKNKEWTFNIQHPMRYDLLLEELTQSFARFAGHLDRNYIFAWMDWDGDNALANAGIIDYGSIRQFGLRHDEYRYDDVDRMSTTLNEQRKKIRVIIQTFAQMTDFLKTGVRKPMDQFAQHPILKKFDQLIESHMLDYFLHQMGLTFEQRTALLKKHPSIANALYQAFCALETTKTSSAARKVPDGTNRPAIFNMRKGMFYLAGLSELPTPHQFFKKILTRFARGQDRKFSLSDKKKISTFFDCYAQLMTVTFGKKPSAMSLKSWRSRVQKVNRTDRITGDGVLMVVDEMMRQRRRKRGSGRVIQESIDHIVSMQTSEAKSNSTSDDFLASLVALVDGQSESI